jgi:PTS system nitrogen regulatory IIA component
MVELADIVPPEGIVLDLPGCTSKRQVLRELSARAATTLGIDQDRLLKALLERERLGTTGIGHGIAIPHAKLAELDRMVGLFARLDHAVDFEAVDDVPSDLIFLLLAPLGADTDSLKALARISRLVRDPAVRERLRVEQDRRAVHGILSHKPASHAA